MMRLMSYLVVAQMAALTGCSTSFPVESVVFAPPVQESPPLHVLVFSKTAGFRHASIPTGVEAIKNLGEKNGLTVEATEDSSAFTDTNLARFSTVVFLNTTGDILNDDQQAAFERYIRSGGGFLGIHAAADTEYDWPWYGRLVGAYFKTHPAIQDATVVVADRVHPSTRHLPMRWQRRDEWYAYRSNPRGKVHVLATLDERTYEGGGMGHDHPIAWCHEFDGGRAFYTGGGHTNESFAEPAFLQHLLGGILWTAGIEKADTGATLDHNFDKVVLDDFVTDPMELTVAPDGRVIFVERGGAVKIWKPNTRSTVTAGFLDVFTAIEDGLLGVTLDPSFSDTGWFYVYYSPAGGEAKNVLSRLTLVDDAFDLSSEVVMLEVVTQREECCHSGGSLTFDADGNLYLSTGDNTSPFASDGYSPIDEREGRSPFDAQKSSANTHDLRGKVLRITPQPDGSYTIPAGNLFARDGLQGRPEIYAMGCRNPFRISVDPATGFVYWGEIGPDAGDPRANRGPAGHDEFNQARGPGNFGWPYFVGNNKPYYNYDFQTNQPGPAFDPSLPINDSPNNTGWQVLPPAQPAWMFYPYGDSAEFPEFGTGGRCAMAGPVYHYDPTLLSDRKLPAYFDNTLFIYEWARDWIMEVKLDENGDVLKINRFAADVKLTRPMDMELGPDGCLYVIEWGTGFGGGNPDARIVRIEYYRGGDRPPIADATADPTSGSAPLQVQFTGDKSRSCADGELRFAWDFNGDGVVDSHKPNPTHSYNQRGNYNAQLVVTDRSGLTSAANIPISVGNTRPSVVIDWPPNGGFVEFGEWIEYRVSVVDAEESQINPDEVRVQLFLGHDTHAHPLQQYHGLQGVIPTLRDDGHGPRADLFTVLRATYSDHGSPGVTPLTASAQVILQPKRKQAEYLTAQQGVRIEKADDPQGAGQAVVFTRDGDYVSYSPVNLVGIDSVTARIAAGADGGTLEFCIDSPSGVVIAEIVVEPSGKIGLEAGAHPVRVEFFERGGGAGLILRIEGGGLSKQVVDASMLLHAASAVPNEAHGDLRPAWTLANPQPGLEAIYYELDDPTTLPEFRSLTAIDSEIVESIAYASTNSAFAGSGKSDNVGAVFLGYITVPQSDFYTFYLESDDGSKFYIGDDLIVNNDGVHAMTEKSAGLTWADVTIPVKFGSTNELFVVYRADGDDVSPLKLNWFEFHGQGVATGHEDQPRESAHDH